MPLFDSEATPSSNVPVNPNLRKDPYRPIAVDSKFEPPTMLLTHVEGSKWVLPEYYSQYTTSDTEVSAQELNRPEVYQQYLRIRDLEIRVTSALQPSQDPTSKEFTVIGTATLYPGIIPSNGDMFIADSGDGRSAIFIVGEIRQLSMLRNTVYEINYELKHYLTPELHNDLKNKITKDTTFVKDFYNFGKNPLLVDSELSNYKELTKWKLDLPRNYFQSFYNQEFSTFLVPDQAVTTYDPFAVELLMKLVDKGTHRDYAQIKILNRDNATDKTLGTVWDALYAQDDEVLNYVSFKSSLISPKNFSGQPRYGSLRYSGIANIYYPTLDTMASLGNIAVSQLRTFNRPIDIFDIIGDDLDGLAYPGINLPSLVPIKPVAADEYYVFSRAFYHVDIPNMSLLEVMTLAFLEKKTVGIKPLLKLCRASAYWGRVEQYYYLPVLLLMLHLSFGDIN